MGKEGRSMDLRERELPATETFQRKEGRSRNRREQDLIAAGAPANSARGQSRDRERLPSRRTMGSPGC